MRLLLRHYYYYRYTSLLRLVYYAYAITLMSLYARCRHSLRCHFNVYGYATPLLPPYAIGAACHASLFTPSLALRLLLSSFSAITPHAADDYCYAMMRATPLRR